MFKLRSGVFTAPCLHPLTPLAVCSWCQSDSKRACFVCIEEAVWHGTAGSEPNVVHFGVGAPLFVGLCCSKLSQRTELYPCGNAMCSGYLLQQQTKRWKVKQCVKRFKYQLNTFYAFKEKLGMFTLSVIIYLSNVFSSTHSTAILFILHLANKTRCIIWTGC